MIRNVTVVFAAAIAVSLLSAESAVAHTNAWTTVTTVVPTQAWPAGQVVYFPNGFPEAVKPWVTRIADAIRKRSVRELGDMVSQGESAQNVLNFWGQYGKPESLYFYATYDVTTDSFTLADNSGRICGCTGSRTADGYRLGRCRALGGAVPTGTGTTSAARSASGVPGGPTGAVTAGGCTTTVAPGNTGPRRLVLSGGAAATLFDKYVELASSRGAVVEYGTLVVTYLNDKGGREEIAGGKPGVFQKIIGIKAKGVIRKKLEGLVAQHMPNANAEAAKVQADIICGN